MTTYIENVTPSDVRGITGISSAVISDADLVAVISGSIVQLNLDVFVRHEDVEIFAIDSWRENKKDSANTIFYMPFFPLADFNNDGKLDTNDVEFYAIQPEGTDSASKKTNFTVSSILDDRYGKIQLASAPSGGDRIFASWASTPVEIENPDPLIKRAIAQLATANAYSNVDVAKVGSFKVGKLTVMQQSPAFKKYMADYGRTVQQIMSKDAINETKFELI